MPVRDCMTNSPFCPANQSSKFAVPGYDSKGCDSCVEERLDKNEIPPCFFNKLDVDGSDKSVDIIDFSMESFAKKVIEWGKQIKT